MKIILHIVLIYNWLQNKASLSLSFHCCLGTDPNYFLNLLVPNVFWNVWQISVSSGMKLPQIYIFFFFFLPPPPAPASPEATHSSLGLISPTHEMEITSPSQDHEKDQTEGPLYVRSHSMLDNPEIHTRQHPARSPCARQSGFTNAEPLCLREPHLLAKCANPGPLWIHTLFQSFQLKLFWYFNLFPFRMWKMLSNTRPRG